MPVKGENMTSGNVPAFLTKLWNLVENPVYDYLIAWDVSGNSFHVFDQGRFAKEILPMYFKHNNMASFIRQLNMYGFRKVVHIEQGLKTESDDVEFQHSYFQKGQEQLLEHIKRKISGHHPPANVKVEPVGVKVKPEDVSKVLNDVRLMKGKQDTMNNKLDSMKRENEVLWRELASLRQKHMKQQQIVNKLIQFLVHLVGGNRGLKRSLPLMLSGASNNESTIAKIPKYDPASQYSVQSPPDMTFLNDQTLGGPTIHDVTDTLQGNDMTDQTPKLQPTSSGATGMTLTQDLVVPTELGHSSSQIDISDLSTNLTSNITELPDQLLTPSDDNAVDIPLSTPQPSSSSLSSLDGTTDKQAVRSLSRQSSISEMSEHLESLHYDLEGLKDVLTSNQYNFDPRTLLGMFKELDPDIKDENDHNESSLLDSSTGSELVQYRTGEDVLPALFDLADLSHYDPDLEVTAGEDASTAGARQTVKPEIRHLSDELD